MCSFFTLCWIVKSIYKALDIPVISARALEPRDIFYSNFVPSKSNFHFGYLLSVFIQCLCLKQFYEIYDKFNDHLFKIHKKNKSLSWRGRPVGGVTKWNTFSPSVPILANCTQSRRLIDQDLSGLSLCSSR